MRREEERRRGEEKLQSKGDGKEMEKEKEKK